MITKRKVNNDVHLLLVVAFSWYKQRNDVDDGEVHVKVRRTIYIKNNHEEK